MQYAVTLDISISVPRSLCHATLRNPRSPMTISPSFIRIPIERKRTYHHHPHPSIHTLISAPEPSYRRPLTQIFSSALHTDTHERDKAAVLPGQYLSLPSASTPPGFRLRLYYGHHHYFTRPFARFPCLSFPSLNPLAKLHWKPPSSLGNG